MSEEQFGHIKIDEANPASQWQGDVPYLDYWRVKFSHNKLTDAQMRFYKFVKKSLLKGEKIRDYNVSQYLLILRDELVKDSLKIKDRNLIINTIKKLYELYGFHDYTLDDVLKREAAYLRDRRLRLYKKDKPAQWIAPGETVNAGGIEFKRGGFYLGKYVRFAKFNTSTDAFVQGLVNVEGPVVNIEGDPKDVDRSLLRKYSTFVEMSDEMQAAVIDWLKGAETDNPQVLIYYLSGIEMRLLGDADTTDDERVQLVRYLLDLIDSPSVTTSSRRTTIHQYISTLIDFTIARYFTDNSEVVISTKSMVYTPQLQRARLAKAFAVRGPESLTNSDIIDIVVAKAIVPPDLPEVFKDVYYKRLRSKMHSALLTHGSWLAPDFYRYKAIGTDNVYAPSDVIIEGLKRESRYIDPDMLKILDKAINTINSLLTDLSPYLKGLEAGASPLRLARLLPRWCDSRLIEGINESLAEISPADGESYRITTLDMLLSTLGVESMEKLDAKDMEALNMELYRFGLRVSTAAIRGTKLGLDEVIAVYDVHYGDVSSRGTLLVSLFLLAWVVGADGVKDRDLRIVDDWLAEQSDKLHQTIPAKAAFIWLANRKLTMSVKRKTKAMQLSKFSKKRDEFVRVLLTLLSDPETASAKRMTRVQTVYRLVGLNPDDIHSDLHRMATSQHTAPRKAGSSAAASLDKAKLKEMAKSTQRAQQILSTVFVDEPTEVPKADKAGTKTEGGKHSDPTLELIRLLINKSEWARADFEKLCTQYGETVGSMLERLNDYSYEHVDEAVAEDDDDTVYIDLDVAGQLTSDE